jgi:transposase
MSKLDPYKNYLHEQWALGHRNIAHLITDIREQGFAGSGTLVFDYLRPLREEAAWRQIYQQWKEQRQRGISAAPISAHQAAWLFVCNPRKLKFRQVWQLEPLRVGDEEFSKAYELAQDFRAMVVFHQAEQLPRWIEEAKFSAIPEFKGFVAGIYRDYDAVCNGLSMEWSQGQTEAQVHRLKLIKRLAYGRANFDLLRLRVLHRSGMPDHQLCV